MICIDDGLADTDDDGQAGPRQFAFGTESSLVDLPANFSAALFMQYRCPVGRGPSEKT